MRTSASAPADRASVGAAPRTASSSASGAWHAALALLVIAAVLAIACLHYRGQTLARGPDQADMQLAYFHDASRAIAEEGIWSAMYTPGLQAGIPNWSNPHWHPLYPFYFNWLGSDATVADTLDRLNWIIYLHLAILGGGAFHLARTLGVRTLPAICVGLVLPWFPAIRSAAAWPQIIAGLSWLPWLFAFQARVYAATDKRQVVSGILGTVLAATALIYAQPAQNLVFAVFGSAMIWACIGGQALAGGGRSGLHRFLRATGWLALAAFLVAVAAGAYLVEVMRFHDQSIRWLGRYGGYVVGDQPLPVGALALHALDADDLGLLAAFEYRKGIGNIYVGVALMFGALAAIVGRMPSQSQASAARALLACAVLAMVFCFSFMVPVLALLPVVNKVREVSWWSCLALVLLVPVATLGLQALADRMDAGAGRPDTRGKRWLWTGLAGLVLAMSATLLAPADYRVEATIALLVSFSALAWLLLARTSTVLARDVACAVVLAGAAWIPFRHNIEFARSDAMLFHADRVQARADATRLWAMLPDAADYRIALGGGLVNAHLLTHAYVNVGFRSIGGGLGPMNYDKHRLLSAPDRAITALYGVKYQLLSDHAARPGDRRLRAGLWLRTDPAALPRLFFVGGGMRVVDDVVASLLADKAHGAVRVVAAAKDLPDGFDVQLHSRGVPTVADVSVSESRRTRLRATVDSDSAGLLVLNEDPGARWQASIDGTPAPTFRVNGFQTAVAIPRAGRHVIEIARPGRLFERIP